MTKEHEERMKMIRKFEGNKKDYPSLNKVMKQPSRKKLKHFLNLVDGRCIAPKILTHENKYPYFSAPLEQLINRFGGSKGTWCRNINLFVALGFLGKVNPFEINCKNGLLFQHSQDGKQKLSHKTGISIDKIKEQSIYYLFPYTEKVLQIAEERAKVMVNNGFNMQSFSKVFLQRCFGLQFANSIFFTKNKETEFTLGLFMQIEGIVLKILEEKHFTYKEEVLSYLQIDTDIYRHHEEIYKKSRMTSAEKIANFEFGRSIHIICNKYNIGYAMATKDLKAIFGLKKNKKILYDKEYVNKNER